MFIARKEIEYSRHCLAERVSRNNGREAVGKEKQIFEQALVILG